MRHDPNRREFLEASGALALPFVIACSAPKWSVEDPVQPATHLHALLARYRGKHPIYGGGLANHLPMELCALSALGASDARLDEWAEQYSPRLAPFPEGGPTIDATNWKSAFGADAALPGLVRFFEGELARRGRNEVLRETLGELAPKMSSELFHCLIRTAFGVRFDDDGEIAHGLAYWVIRPLELGTPARTSGAETHFANLLERVRKTPALAKAELTGSSNPRRMAQAAAVDGFSDVADSFQVGDDSLRQFATASAAIFRSNGDFTALHALTSTHASRILLPFFPDPELALRCHARGLLAAYVRMGAPVFAEAEVDVRTDWDDVEQRAIASADDHDAKFVFACREELDTYREPLFALAAERRLSRAPDGR